MEFIKTPGRIYAENSEGQMIAEVTFPLDSEGVVAIDHTYVADELRGQGVADKLMEETYELLKTENLRAKPVCSYAVAWYKRHPEKNDIVIAREIDE